MMLDGIRVLDLSRVIAGPYCATLMADISSHGVAVEGRVAAGHVMLELTFDVGEQARGADSEQLRFEPFAAKFLFHQDLVGNHILGR